MADDAEQFAGRFYRYDTRRSLLVLTGRSGTAKTKTAHALSKWATKIARAACQQGGWPRIPSVMHLHWPNVADDFKNGQFGVLQDCFEAGLLVIDDAGSEYDRNGFVTEKLCQILTKRERKFTVVTTNIEPEQWDQKFDVRISDRLMRNSVVANLHSVESFSLWSAMQPQQSTFALSR